MPRHEAVEKCFDAVMELKGVEAFKDSIKRLHVFLKNKETYSLPNIALPNYLWSVKPGGGVTTLVNAFAEYLYEAKAIEFCGTVKSFEFNLAYITPDAFFGELSRFHNTISGFAGHNRFFKGIVCIHIDEWLNHTKENHFAKILNYISNHNDKLVVIFCIHADTKSAAAVETTLCSYLRLESLSLRFPNSNELVEFVESQYIMDKGFAFTECARELLGETIKEIAAGKQFNGFKSVKQLAYDILFNIFTTDLSDNKHISASMLSNYTKDSEYVKRTKIHKRRIGFAEAERCA